VLAVIVSVSEGLDTTCLQQDCIARSHGRLKISYIRYYEASRSEFYFSVLINFLQRYGHNIFLLMNSCIKGTLHGISLFYISVTLKRTCETEEMMFNFTGTSLTELYITVTILEVYIVSKEE
jgi:hypothetical protein